MELKKGYMRTEVGIIPEDWTVSKMGKIANVIMGQSPLSEFYNNKGIGLPLIQGNADIENRKTIVRSYSSMITKRGKLGDIIMSVRAPVGEVAKSTFDCCLGRGVCAISFKNEYLYHYLVFFEKSWAKFSTGSTFDSINSTQVIELPIPIPKDDSEQLLIANALSDMDALISQTEKLIEKKKAIKQGAMQELLKPKEGWVTKKLGELVIYKNGKAHENCVVDHGEFIIVNSKFVSTEGRVAKYSNENLCPLEKNEILMVLSDIPNGKAIAKCFYVSESNKYTLNQRICSLKAVNIHPKFLFYLVNRNKYFLAFDDGVKQTNLRNEDVLQCPITFPPDYKVQEYSAQVITEIEMVIKLQNIKLTKLKQQKQGMMQALLTGKIRLLS